MSTETEGHGMDCYVCGCSVATEPEGGHKMPVGWGFVLRAGYCADGKPGLEPFYACPDCKEDDGL